MDSNSLNGVLRAIVPAICAFAVGKGWIAAGTVGEITTAVVAIAAAIWSIVSNKPNQA